MTSTTTRQALSRRQFRVGDLQFDALIAGEGPLVMLLRGFPESGRSWRAQIQALADAGCTAVAPNLRGYGGSSKPPQVEDYALMRSVGDAYVLWRQRGLGARPVRPRLGAVVLERGSRCSRD
jgi:pimeloyl-ACP methyl ester carboxylesterase